MLRVIKSINIEHIKYKNNNRLKAKVQKKPDSDTVANFPTDRLMNGKVPRPQ